MKEIENEGTLQYGTDGAYSLYIISMHFKGSLLSLLLTLLPAVECGTWDRGRRPREVTDELGNPVLPVIEDAKQFVKGNNLISLEKEKCVADVNKVGPKMVAALL